MAINFKLKKVELRTQEQQDDDPMRRAWLGWDPQRSAQENFAKNRGLWLLGQPATRERYATFSIDGGRICMVAQITGLETYSFGDERADKRAMTGRVLDSGDPVHEHYVGGLADNHRNPVTYISDPGVKFDGRPCACGCSAMVSGRSRFSPGHDQVAVHDRIGRRWGSTIAFVDWFDAEHPTIAIEIREERDAAAA